MFMSVINGFRAAVSTLGIPLLIAIYRRKKPRFSHSTPPPLPTDPEDSGSPLPSDIPRSRPGTTDPLDRTLILTALFFDIAGYLGYALAPTGILFTLFGAAAAFGAIGLSTSEAALTKCVQPSASATTAAEGGGGGGDGSRVGELLAGLGLLQAVVRIVAPAVVNVVYGATVAVGAPGVAFWGMAGVLGVGWGLAWGVRV